MSAPRSPQLQTRLMVKYRHVDGKVVVKATDNDKVRQRKSEVELRSAQKTKLTPPPSVQRAERGPGPHRSRRSGIAYVA